MAEKATKLDIYGKLLEIRRATKLLVADAQNKDQGFKYVKSSKVLSEVREKMNDLGVLLVPNVTKTNFFHKHEYGNKMHLTEIWLDMVWVNVDNPGTDTLAVPWYTQGTDQHEKGVGKAYTYGEKSFILKFFNIPTDKWDPDAASGKVTEPTESAPTSNGGKVGGATKKQYGLLYVKGKNAGMKQENVKAFVRWYRAGEYLLVKEASDLIDNFDNHYDTWLESLADKSVDAREPGQEG